LLILNLTATGYYIIDLLIVIRILRYKIECSFTFSYRHALAYGYGINSVGNNGTNSPTVSSYTG